MILYLVVCKDNDDDDDDDDDEDDDILAICIKFPCKIGFKILFSMKNDILALCLHCLLVLL